MGLQNIYYASSTCKLRSLLQKSPVTSSISLTPSDPSLWVYSWPLYAAPTSSLVLTLMVPWAWGVLARPHSCWQAVVTHHGGFHIRSGNWNKGEMKWKGVTELWAQRELRMGSLSPQASQEFQYRREGSWLHSSLSCLSWVPWASICFHILALCSGDRGKRVGRQNGMGQEAERT